MQFSIVIDDISNEIYHAFFYHLRHIQLKSHRLSPGNVIALLPVLLLIYPNICKPNQSAAILESDLSKRIHQPTITAIYKDQNQFLWVGTQQGLYRYDGANLIEFNSDPNATNSIPTSDIRGIFEDSDNNLNVATFGKGLLRCNDSKNKLE